MGKRGPKPLPPGQAKVRNSLRLPPTAWAKLAELAERHGTTQTAILEALIAQA